ncbi:hypothetical protein [Kibdelosporangium philippinense]|uniref:hypothetical protein n=1 Tax=Kibdelosporangium philippinense TaxID=211113 RepID=UPI00360C78F4
MSDTPLGVDRANADGVACCRRGPGTVMRVHDLREIVNAILYVSGPDRLGVSAARLPACKTV